MSHTLDALNRILSAAIGEEDASNPTARQTLNTIIDRPEGIERLPKELVDFARRQIVNATLYKGGERRHADRHTMMLPVRAVEVGSNNEPIGSEIDLITREISSTGIGLIHVDSIEAKRMAIQLSVAGTEVNLVIDVLWRGPMGPFYGAGGKFIVKLDEFPAGSDEKT